jgi:CubicO group peptidase (beta-lactamase class C family)
VSYKGGQHYPYYDLASLTKVLFTVPAMMLAFERKLWNLEASVQHYLSWWPHSQTKIVDLLTHSSGLVWWKPFYQELAALPSLEERWEWLRRDIIQSPLNEPGKAVYSDVGFLSLAFLLKEMFAQPLPKIWEGVKAEFAADSQLHWIEPGHSAHPISAYAPTELCPWRGRRIQGEVHDENAWALGSLSTHAGLFGHCADAAAVFLKIREYFFDNTHPMHNTVRLFMQRQIPVEQGDWAMGFVLPTTGASSSGRFFSPRSIGHTGFTGTSIWWDPERDLMIVIVSNRVFYGRDKREFAKLRPLLHDEIVSLWRRVERN